MSLQQKTWRLFQQLLDLAEIMNMAVGLMEV
jgi:hypothetical protein